MIVKGFENKDALFPQIVPNFDQEGRQILLLINTYIKSMSTLMESYGGNYESERANLMKSV